MKKYKLFKEAQQVSLQTVRLVVADNLLPFYVEKLVQFAKRYGNYSVIVEKVSSLTPKAYEKTICFGDKQVKEVLGRKIQIMSARRGYSWLHVDGYVEPVFWLPSPKACKKNRFVGQAMIDDFKSILSCPTPKYDTDVFYEVIETPEDAQEALADFKTSKWVAYDCETAGVMFCYYFEVVMVAATTDAGRTFVFDLKAIRNKQVKETLIQFLEDADIPKVGHNLKYDMLSPKSAWGCQVKGFYSDTQLKRKILQADALSGLELCSELVGTGGYKQEFGEALAVAKKMIQRERRANQDQVKFAFYEHPALDFIVKRRDLKADSCAYALVPEKTLALYCARDAYATYKLEKRLTSELSKEPGLKYIWDEVVSKCVPALERMESWGLLVDRDAMVEFEDFVLKQLEETRLKLQQRGLENPGSSAQVGDFLFNKLNLPVVKRSEKTNEPSTDAGVLKQLKDEHEAVAELLEFRRLGKLGSAYGEKLRLHISKSGRIHPQLKLDGTRCMPAGELVLTSKGYLKVEDVKRGMSVLTHKGRAKKVSNTYRYKGNFIYKVELSNGLELRTNGNHQYFTQRGWVEAARLTVTDTISVHSEPEVWKKVRGWPYKVSSWGRVKSLKTDKIMKLQPKGCWGHLKVTLSRNKAQKRGPDRKDFPVHRLVAKTFSVPGKGPEVLHKNGVAFDNTVGNLVFGTREENWKDTLSHDKFWDTLSKQRKLTQEQVNEMRSVPKIGKGDGTNEKPDSFFAFKYGVSRELIRDIRNNKKWKPRPKKKDIEFSKAQVIRVSCVGVEHVYGVEVEDDHSHVTGGIVTHNTGRLSCSNPGLHQIPRAESTEGRMIKNCFIAPEGHRLVQLDYSQLELRVAAMLSEDKTMIDMFHSGEDFHSQTAALVAPLMWGVPTEAVRHGLIECSENDPEYKKYKKYRSAAKQFNFGLLYGMTDRGMADRIGCSKGEATKLREVIMGAWTGLASWIAEKEQQVNTHGYTTTWWNGQDARKRDLWIIDSKDHLDVSKARNAAINTPVQGTASDYCAASIGKVVHDIEAGLIDAKLVLSVHDSIILECKAELVEDTARKVRDIMQGWYSKGVPLKVDCEFGTRWGSLVALNL